MKEFLDFYKKVFNEGELIKQDKNYFVLEDKNGNRLIKSMNFNMLFRKSDGLTYKWGENFSKDPDYNPFGNEIADIEITKACRGIRGKDGRRKVCEMCYKGNIPCGHYMSFEKFKKIFDLLNEAKTMTQIAFGVDAEASEELNPDIWKIIKYTKENGVTPNITVADITEDTAKNIVSNCGAVAVSAYQFNKECCYNSVKLLTDESEKQEKPITVNIHALISKETYNFIFELLDDLRCDTRLKKVNAIVFLSLKQKGRGMDYNKLSEQEYKKIIDYCFENDIRFGMDSCSCNKFFKAIQEKPDCERIKTYCEPCEKCLFSLYINADGRFFPCSFMEGEGEWKEGIDLNKCKDFVKEVWYSDKVSRDRSISLNSIKQHGCNSCSYYDI